MRLIRHGRTRQRGGRRDGVPTSENPVPEALGESAEHTRGKNNVTVCVTIILTTMLPPLASTCVMLRTPVRYRTKMH